MNRSRAAALALLLLAGCIAGHFVRDPGSLPGSLPFLAVRAAPRAGQSPIMLLAGLSGRVRIDEECVMIEPGDGGSRVLPLFYDGTTVGRDKDGFYLRDAESGAVFRDGDRFRGGGGFMPIAVLSERGNTRRTVPPACLAKADMDNVVSINPGMTGAPD